MPWSCGSTAVSSSRAVILLQKPGISEEPATYEKVLTAFHAGRFRGKDTRFLLVISAFTLLALSLTGPFLWVRRMLFKKPGESRKTIESRKEVKDKKIYILNENRNQFQLEGAEWSAHQKKQKGAGRNEEMVFVDYYSDYGLDDGATGHGSFKFGRACKRDGVRDEGDEKRDRGA